jgi:hypothetical protein
MSAMEKKDADMHEKHLKGPTNCPLERLMAIYKCVAAENVIDPRSSESASFHWVKIREKLPTVSQQTFLCS